MLENTEFCKSPRTMLPLLLLMVGCVSRENEVQAIANGVRGGMGGSKGYFASEAASICGEMPKAETSIVPPFGKICSRGCRCSSASDVDVDPRTVYDCDEWNAREWQMIKFAGMYTLDGKPTPIVYFHHQARWHRTDQGCRLDFTVYGDLDEDGVYSTYTTWTETTPDGAIGHRPDESLLWE